MEKKNENRTTFFTWKLDEKNDIIPGELKACNSENEIGEVKVVPFMEDSSIPMKSCNCPLFIVGYNWNLKTVSLICCYTVGAGQPHMAKLGQEPGLYSSTMNINILDGTVSFNDMNSHDKIPADFSLVPEQVLECCYMEIKRMRGIEDSVPAVDQKFTVQLLEEIIKDR